MPPLLLGLSGPSSSGKTTLARLLRRILPFRTIILHQDDFYRPESELPLRDGLVNWDCAASLDLPYMKDCLNHLRNTGYMPVSLESKEDQNDAGPSGVSEEEIQRLVEEIGAWARKEGMVGFDERKEGGKGSEELEVGEGGEQVYESGSKAASKAGQADSEASKAEPEASQADSEASKAEPETNEAAHRAAIVIVDGFLLYGRSVQSALLPLFSPRLMLRATHATAKARREARTGYVTLEGFWADPPGYVDRVVWPEYVAEHGYLFEDGDVEGEVDTDQVERWGIRVCPGMAGWGMGMVLEWALAEVKTAMGEQWKGREG